MQCCCSYHKNIYYIRRHVTHCSFKTTSQIPFSSVLCEPNSIKCILRVCASCKTIPKIDELAITSLECSKFCIKENKDCTKQTVKVPNSKIHTLRNGKKWIWNWWTKCKLLMSWCSYSSLNSKKSLSTGSTSNILQKHITTSIPISTNIPYWKFMTFLKITPDFFPRKYNPSLSTPHCCPQRVWWRYPWKQLTLHIRWQEAWCTICWILHLNSA